MDITKGKKIDDIPVVLSYKIIELFSAGLYSSPNKAFEELVCNSYDASATNVGVYISPDLTVEGAYIWVCDNGASMDQDELKDLWKVGESTKRQRESTERPPIGRFGIGKLATYILANHLTYICKKNGKFIATNMNYSQITRDSEEKFFLDEIELTEHETEELLTPYIKSKTLLPFELFGDRSIQTWTFSIMTGLKAKAAEIKEGRLKWILRTALPLNPNFCLHFNGTIIESSKINNVIQRRWIIGKDDETVEKIDGCCAYKKNETYYIDFPNLKEVHGEFVLYEDSLIEGKSNENGRSHGIFLMVRGRLINLDDPLLGMEAFSHGAFNRTRIIVYADGLDDNIASTREVVKESIPYNQLRNYIKKKFNNEVKKVHYENEARVERENSISYRLTQTSMSLSRTPIISFTKKYFEQEISNPWLLERIDCDENLKEEFLEKLVRDVEQNTLFSSNTIWENMAPEDPIAKFNITTRTLKINLLHPFIANYCDEIKSKLFFEFIAITEVLTEAHMYELSITEDDIHNVMMRRDKILRELVFGDRSSAPLVATMVKDALSDAVGLEDAIYKAFLTLGFETTKIGGKNEPDGTARAVLGYSDAEKCENYSLTYDAKSTAKSKIAAATAHLSGLQRHKEKYNANFCVVIAINFEGIDDPSSAINIETKQQKITAMRARDLVKLLLYAVPKQISLKKIRNLFESCYTPNEVSDWIDNVIHTDIERGPINELLDIIYDLSKNDVEPPEIASIRLRLNEKLDKKLSKEKIRELMQSLKVFVPEFISIEGDKIGLNSNPELIKQAINEATHRLPTDIQQLYIDALCN